MELRNIVPMSLHGGGCGKTLQNEFCLPEVNTLPETLSPNSYRSMTSNTHNTPTYY